MVFPHQFSSIAGAGPVTGPIIATMFGWLPALLWILFGGVFFGAVHDFGAMYASVKNEGKSIGLIIEQYIGRTGKKLFLMLSWIFSLLVIAAFSDIVATTFNGYGANGAAISSPLYCPVCKQFFAISRSACCTALIYLPPRFKLRYCLIKYKSTWH